MAKRRRVTQGSSDKAIGYIRVSTDDQRLGPKAQAKALDAWSAREGVQLLAVFVDHGVSGGNSLADRPGLLEAIAALQSLGAGVLVAAKRDRLARDVGHARSIEAETAKAGAVVRTADGRSDGSGSAALLAKGLDDLLGEYERVVISERTTAALAVKKAKGERLGSIPFGYRVGADQTHLEPDPAEQATLELIRGLRGAGTPLRAIVNKLNADAVPARGKRWHLTTVSRLLAA
jgi:DNA invertase Pin-like site-specific DNA recombinase